MDKMDKTIFKAQSFVEASKNNNSSKHLSSKQRLRKVHLLIMYAYGLDPKVEHRMDKTAFSMHKQNS